MLKKNPSKTGRKMGRQPIAEELRRVVLQRTFVAPETLAGILADGRPLGRVIDEMCTAYGLIRRLSRAEMEKLVNHLQKEKASPALRSLAAWIFIESQKRDEANNPK